MNWKKVIGYKKPDEVEVGKTTVYLRRNIETAVDDDDNECWEYEECSMTLKEYKHYIEILSSVEMQTILERLDMQEDAQAELLLAQMDTQATLSNQDDVLAEILLMQMEG